MATPLLMILAFLLGCCWAFLRIVAKGERDDTVTVEEVTAADFAMWEADHAAWKTEGMPVS